MLIPNMSPILAIVSLRARNNFTIFALRRSRSMVMPSKTKERAKALVHGRTILPISGTEVGGAGSFTDTPTTT